MISANDNLINEDKLRGEQQTSKLRTQLARIATICAIILAVLTVAGWLISKI